MTPSGRITTIVVLVLAFSLLGASAGRTQIDAGWRIEKFHTDILIQRDGSLHITETIAAAFDVPKHGIFRDIPVRYPYDASHERVYGLTIRSVTDGSGMPRPYERSQAGKNVELKIGDATELVTGPQIYVITYDVRGALNAFPDHDELFWNVNGANWPVPTAEASAFVRLDGGGIERVQCYEGVNGSQQPCNSLSAADRAGFVTRRALQPGEQLTVVVGLRKGAIPEPVSQLVNLHPGFVDSYFRVTPWTVGIALAILAAGFAVLFGTWWRGGRDRVYTTVYYLSHNPEEEKRPFFHRDQVVVEYTPPEGLRPAQMGLLLDQRVDQKDLTATIVDFAVHGYLKITELDKAWALGRADWKLTVLKQPKDLQPYERTLFKGLMGDRTEVLLSDLHTDYPGALLEAQRELYGDSVRHGWFAGDPASERGNWLTLGFAFLVGGALLTWGLATFAGEGLVALPVPIFGLVMLPLSRAMPRRTAKGSELLRRILGFRLYITTAEKDRQKFNEQQNIFAAYLPYAIVFGCVEKWAHVFADAQTEKVLAGWYEPLGAYSVLALSSHLQGFSHSVAHCVDTAPVVVPPGGGGGGFWGGGFGSGFSGGFGGGGGFAGGGGGGGGGGSW
ncbi:MAG TPA: DUF2207 domain-containing protein [Dehalococcoidia bacterium]|nr:DUF2207 domain-containing protein [Dehalococcoidia bacterium]